MTEVWAVDLPASQKIVLLALADCANDEGKCWPGMASLSAKCSKSERTIQTMLGELERAGHIERQQVAGKGCFYTVHPRKICTPAKSAPPQNLREPPQNLHPTPAKSAPKPSKNHKEPSYHSSSGDDDADDDGLKPEHVVEKWNAVAPRIGKPCIRNLTPTRREAVRARIAQYTVDDFIVVFGNIQGSRFLRDWRGCGFDWAMKRANFQKILEGNYNG